MEKESLGYFSKRIINAVLLSSVVVLIVLGIYISFFYRKTQETDGINLSDKGQGATGVTTGDGSAATTEKDISNDADSNTGKVLAEGKVQEILAGFAGTKNYASMTQGDSLLLDVANGKNDNLKTRLEEAEASLEAEEIGDSIDMRGYFNATTKICVARSIIDENLKQTCQLTAPATLVVEDIDDLTAVEAVLPAFLNGVAYYEDGDYAQSKAFLDMVVAHKAGGITRWNDANFPASDPIYGKIQEETTRILADKNFQ